MHTIMTDQDHNFNDQADSIDVLQEKLMDTHTPGYLAEFDPDEAEKAGIFDEDALSTEDAIDSSIDFALKEEVKK